MGRALAWIAVCIGLSVGAVSAVLGMAPTYVKPSPSGVLVHCGPALFHTGPRPSPWCDARPDVWRIAAEI